MDAPPDQRPLVPARAASFVVALLALAAVVGHLERRPVPVDDIALDALPTQMGEWVAREGELATASDGSWRMLTRTYSDRQGHRAYLTVQATRTRLGSLRDWSVAAMAEGWTATARSTWRSADGTVVARLERLENGPSAQVAVTSYLSPQSSSDSFTRAQLLGWRDRLLGRKWAWASCYLVAALTPRFSDMQAIAVLGGQAGSELRALLAGASARPTDAAEPGLAAAAPEHGELTTTAPDRLAHRRPQG